MAVRDTVDDGHCDCIEKHDVSSEQCGETKFTEFQELCDEIKIQEKSSRTSRRVKIRKSGHEDRVE